MAAKKVAWWSKNNARSWRLPVVLIIIQALFIFHSFGYIRYEDLAESVRNPFWLEHHTIYDGTSSNVGWYGTMLIIYKLIGFHLYAARYFRIFLYAVFIFTTHTLLKRYFGTENTTIPLITIGLSPTLLYLNTFQAAYGLDVQYFVIMIGLVLSLAENQRKNLVTTFGLGALAMWTAMSYPPGLFLLPALSLAYFFKVRSLALPGKQIFLLLLTGLTGFLAPLLLMLAYLSDPGRLLHDSSAGQGIFRGSGRVATNLTQFISNTQDNLSDLFVTGISAQFELPQVEFSNLYPIAAVAAVLLFSKTIFFGMHKYRPYILVAITLLLSCFVGTGLSSWGLRTNASALVGFYGLFTLVWVVVTSAKPAKMPYRNVLLALLSLITIHHVVNLWPSYQFVGKPSKVSYQLANEAIPPNEQLAMLVDYSQQRSLELQCLNELKQPVSCRYQEIYAAVTGTCLWNSLACYPVLGYDVRSGQYLKLDPSIWLAYYWGH